jgi:hypothetical protein
MAMPARLTWATTLRLCGVLGLVAAIALEGLALELLGPLSEEIAFVATTLVIVGAAASRTRVFTPDWVRSWGLAGLASLIYAVSFFAGFGRLNLAGLLVVGAVAISELTPSFWHKRIMVIALLPCLVIAGLIGMARSTNESEPSIGAVVTEGRGLGSAIDPFLVYGELIRRDMQGDDPFPRQYGGTLLDALPASFPRALWADKPIGFGSELTLWLQPQLFASGHSIAATAFGEWFVNFGWLGMVLVPLVFFPALLYIDRRQVVWRPTSRVSSGFSLAIIAVTVAGVPDLVWAGLFTFMSRTGLRVLLLLPLWIATRALSRFEERLPSHQPKAR